MDSFLNEGTHVQLRYVYALFKMHSDVLLRTKNASQFLAVFNDRLLDHTDNEELAKVLLVCVLHIFYIYLILRLRSN